MQHVHPQSGVTLHGKRLCPGTRIRRLDRYDSTDGKWRHAGRTHAGGKVPAGNHVIWVRPTS